MSKPFHVARAQVGALARSRPADHPDLLAARLRMHEEVLVDAIDKAIKNGPPMTNELRQRVLALVPIPGNEAVVA